MLAVHPPPVINIRLPNINAVHPPLSNIRLPNINATLALIGTATALPTLFPLRYQDSCADGVCMSTIECGIKKGRSMGSCPLGTCCRMGQSCGERIVANNTFFTSPLQLRAGSSCGVEVEKKWHLAGVCQMRLDFVEFDILGPNFRSGACIHDSFTVVGASSPVPVICGHNSRQHMYIDVRKSKSINLFMDIGRNLTDRLWRIRVTQIPCNSKRLAPVNCLQYFEKDSGILASFNYGNPLNDSSYPLNLKYQMCFRKACLIQLSQMGYFGLGRNASSDKFGSDVGALEVDSQCVDTKNDNKTDEKAYLLIDDARFCGDKFLRGVETKNEISAIGFNSRVKEFQRRDPNNAPYAGFQLQYKLNCARQSV